MSIDSGRDALSLGIEEDDGTETAFFQGGRVEVHLYFGLVVRLVDITERTGPPSEEPQKWPSEYQH